jgi:hypothetical protein
MAWIENGPVSLPRGGALAFAVLLIGGAAVAGLGLGFTTGWHGGEQRTTGAIDPNQDIDQAVEAKPLITIGAPPAPPPPVTNAAPAANTVAAKKADDTDDESNDIDARTAAVQAVQSKPAQQAPNIDDLLASPTERPQAPAKPTTDEQAPPAKTDVPF